MTKEPDIVRLAALVADPTRAKMLTALLGASILTAGELAAAAGVTAQTASGHLRMLEQAGFLASEQQGRRRLYRLRTAAIVHFLEHLRSFAVEFGYTRIEQLTSAV